MDRGANAITVIFIILLAVIRAIWGATPLTFPLHSALPPCGHVRGRGRKPPSHVPAVGRLRCGDAPRGHPGRLHGNGECLKASTPTRDTLKGPSPRASKRDEKTGA